MIRLYTSSGCLSCRKAKQFLKDNNLKFEEINIFKDRVTRDDIKFLLEKSTNGFDDIISKRSKIVIENKINIDELTINELIELIIKYPSVLKRPIIVDCFNYQTGYDQDEIERFLPKLKDYTYCDKTCPSYNTCDHKREKE